LETESNGGLDVRAIFSQRSEGKTVSSYEPNQTVFAQGDMADAVFYIHSGKLRISVLSEQGKEAIVAIHGPDEFFGEGCLNGHAIRLGSAIAMAKSEVMRVERAEMMRLLHEDSSFSEMFISHQLARTARVEADLVDQLFNSSEKRLARALLLLANFGKDGKPEPVIAKVSQERLAEMIGSTRSRVNFFMNKFRKLGFITYNGHLEVHSSLLNIVLNDQALSDRDEPDSSED
jgi:CRP/FNR family cyclic AMP-dependent transcriptional regulator